MPITAKGFNKLAKFHGLDPETHTDQDVDDKIKNAVTEDDLEQLGNRLEAAEGQLIEQDLAKYAARIGKNEKAQAHWKALLVSNRANALEMLEALPEVTETNENKGKQPLHNRSTAGTPATLDAAKGKDKDAVMANAIRNRAHAIRKENPRLPYGQAWKQAETELANKEGK